MIRLKALLLKEFIQMRRDRVTFGIMVVLPIVQLLIFGFAINTDVKHLPTIVFDQSLQQESRDLLAALEASEYFQVKASATGYEEVNAAIDGGQAKVGIIIPPDYAENIKHGRSASVQVIVDASDSMSASSAIAAAQMIGQLRSQEILLQRMQQSGSPRQPAMPIDIRIRPWYNPDQVSAFYMVPGILGMVLTMTMVMITSMAIVREREKGTMEQLIVTPLKSWELMLGKIIPYVFVGYVQATLALVVGYMIFDVPVRGSLLLLYGLTTLFVLASLSLGVFVSTIAQTQMQAMQMSFFIFMPSVLLSGFMFPRAAMPELFYQMGHLLPLTYYLEILRSILLKGTSIAFLWSQVFALTVYILTALTLSIIKFQKKLG